MDYRKKPEMDPRRNKKGDNLRGVLPIVETPFKLIDGYSRVKCQVLQLTLSNHTNEYTADKLGMSEKTVERYITDMRKDGHPIAYMQRIDNRTSEGLRTIYLCLSEATVDFMDKEAKRRKVSRGVVARELVEWGMEAAGAPEEW